MTMNNDADTNHDTDTDTRTPPMSTPESAHDAEDPADDHIDEELPSLTPSVREFVHADRDQECELCGADGTGEDTDLEIHHRVQKADGGTNHPRNLLLICQTCHRRHHGNEQITVPDTAQQPTDTETNTPTEPDPDPSQTDTDAEPLPPRSTPNGADQEIIAYVESHGPTTTGELAAALEYSKQYMRRQCWKLSGEQLIVPQSNDTWELKERASDEKIQTGLPEDPKEAKRAGRDEMIRRMSAHGMGHTQIAEITGYSRSTIDIAVNRARALRLDDDTEDIAVDLATVATRLSALLEVIDQAQLQAGAGTESTTAD